jgi:UDP-N-acetylglucosamine 4,6-dehydratase
VQANGFTYPKGTRISVARWGNVLGSRGSVVPLWRAAKAAGEKLKLTRKDMTRFIITMPQAVDFVMACVFSMRGGETFVPILPSATMWDLAMAIAEDESMIETLNELRPGGEKLAEILLSEEEPLRTVRRQLHGGFSGPVEALTVLPGHRTWSNESYAGTPVDLAMTYRSDQGPFLTVEELRKMLEEVA